ncbi:MAG: DUF1501 domain-containing protein, partial [Planctomycetes bacterium]|nr:DUF1501 domain-containing protein [Planctomycetota bacterium]
MNKQRDNTILAPLVTRRGALQAGAIGMGLGLSELTALRSMASDGQAAKAKSVLFIFLTGGLSHHDSFDMKPDAPDDIRGEFQPIATSVPGVHICEHLPQIAARADRYALLRTLSHKDNNHLMSTHHVLTGTLQPGAFFDK